MEASSEQDPSEDVKMERGAVELTMVTGCSTGVIKMEIIKEEDNASYNEYICSFKTEGKIMKSCEVPDLSSAQFQDVVEMKESKEVKDIPKCTHLMSCGGMKIKNELKKDPDTANLKKESSQTSDLQVKEEKVFERKWINSGSNVEHFGLLKIEEGVKYESDMLRSGCMFGGIKVEKKEEVDPEMSMSGQSSDSSGVGTLKDTTGAAA